MFRSLKNWNLDIIWDLVLGIWNLYFRGRLNDPHNHRRINHLRHLEIVGEGWRAEKRGKYFSEKHLAR